MAISLKAARINANMTQSEVANALGITTTTLSKWENGITVPSIAHVKGLVEIYSIPFDNIDFTGID